VRGKLHRSNNGCVGISWQKEEGNEFWLTSLIGQLNNKLKALL
jgi:hypothetical protein